METTTQERSKTHGGSNIEQCIIDCLECYQECLSCLSHCLDRGRKHAEQKHITLMMECAQMCNMSATLMTLNGQFAYEHCQLCAEVCDACEESCRSMGSEDSVMQNCADMCHTCAETCRSMSH